MINFEDYPKEFLLIISLYYCPLLLKESLYLNYNNMINLPIS